MYQSLRTSEYQITNQKYNDSFSVAEELVEKIRQMTNLEQNIRKELDVFKEHLQSLDVLSEDYVKSLNYNTLNFGLEGHIKTNLRETIEQVNGPLSEQQQDVLDFPYTKKPFPDDDEIDALENTGGKNTKRKRKRKIKRRTKRRTNKIF